MATKTPEIDAPPAPEPGRWDRIAPQRERLRRLAASRLGPGADAEDCVHEALIRAATFENLDASRLDAFLTTVTLRLCADHQRRATRQQRFLPKYVSLEVEEVEEGVCEKAAASWLLQRTGELAPREREVMLARARGMSTMEVSEHFRISYKSAESAYTRARNRMRKLYDEEMARS
jgi:RNA polymerase sigma-70 factor (ECF subfamily)